MYIYNIISIITLLLMIIITNHNDQAEKVLKALLAASAPPSRSERNRTTSSGFGGEKKVEIEIERERVFLGVGNSLPIKEHPAGDGGAERAGQEVQPAARIGQRIPWEAVDEAHVGASDDALRVVHTCLRYAPDISRAVPQSAIETRLCRAFPGRLPHAVAQPVETRVGRAFPRRLPHAVARPVEARVGHAVSRGSAGAVEAHVGHAVSQQVGANKAGVGRGARRRSRRVEAHLRAGCASPAPRHGAGSGPLAGHRVRAVEWRRVRAAEPASAPAAAHLCHGQRPA